jgi:hypothetical protein
MLCSPFLALDDRPGLCEQIVPCEFALDEVEHVPRVLDRFVVAYESELPQAALDAKVASRDFAPWLAAFGLACRAPEARASAPRAERNAA